jgi:hypothetical protein
MLSSVVYREKLDISFVASGGFSSVWLVDGDIIKATTDEFTIDFYRYLNQLGYPKGLPEAVQIPSSTVESYNLESFDMSLSEEWVTNSEMLHMEHVYGYLTGQLSYEDFSFFKMPFYLESHKNERVSHYLGVWIKSCKELSLDVWAISSIENLYKVFDIFKKVVPPSLFEASALDNLISFVGNCNKKWCLDPCDSNFLVDADNRIIFADLIFGDNS